MSKLNRVFAAGVLLAGLPMAAMAQPAPVNVIVSVTVQSTCSALTSTQQANFGTHTPTVATAVTAEGIVTLTCNRGAAPLISVEHRRESYRRRSASHAQRRRELRFV